MHCTALPLTKANFRPRAATLPRLPEACPQPAFLSSRLPLTKPITLHSRRARSPATMPSAAVLPPFYSQLSSQTGRLRRKSGLSKPILTVANIEAPVSDKASPRMRVISQSAVEVSSLAGNAVYEAERNTLERQLSSLDLTLIQEPTKEQAEADTLPRTDIIARSVTILRENDFGGYTIPAKGLYPYQWNWDSALVAMGWAVFDEARAWEELDTLFSAQWSDGMVPHIVFHRPCSTYFPGPDTWQAGSSTHSSTGITQPPVAAISVRRIVEGSANKEAALRRAEELFPKLLRWHRWFKTARDPDNRGLVATLHPWESGMDNSPMWDEALMAVPVDAIPPYTRKDLGHVDSAMRPKQAEYDRYLTLLYRFRAVGYDPAQLYHMSPFRVSDICTNSVLYRANRDLRWLALQLNQTEAVVEIDSWLERARVGFATLWDGTAGIYRSQNQLTGALIPAATSGGFLPLFAGVASTDQAAALADTIGRWSEIVRYSVPSFDPSDAPFEALRYWRGPVWAIVNWMMTDGLRSYGYHKQADRIVSDTRMLTRNAGMYEYFDPLNGAGAGGNNFSWTAAMCLMWLDRETEPAKQSDN